MPRFGADRRTPVITHRSPHPLTCHFPIRGSLTKHQVRTRRSTARNEWEARHTPWVWWRKNLNCCRTAWHSSLRRLRCVALVIREFNSASFNLTWRNNLKCSQMRSRFAIGSSLIIARFRRPRWTRHVDSDNASIFIPIHLTSGMLPGGNPRGYEAELATDPPIMRWKWRRCPRGVENFIAEPDNISLWAGNVYPVSRSLEFSYCRCRHPRRRLKLTSLGRPKVTTDP